MSRRVLIIEDSPEQADILQTIVALDRPEALVLVASSGEEGVRLAGEHEPQIVITDHSLPGALDGLGVAHSMSVMLPEAKLVLVTGRYPEMKESDAALFSAILTKPFRVDKLRAILGRLWEGG